MIPYYFFLQLEEYGEKSIIAWDIARLLTEENTATINKLAPSVFPTKLCQRISDFLSAICRWSSELHLPKLYFL